MPRKIVMAENNAHLGESVDERLKRFQNGSPIESIETLLNSLDNYFNNEIRATISSSQYPQTSLLFLGIHAAILTISEAFWNDKGLTGYKLFLEKYIDSGQGSEKFSLIAQELHDWRNIVAHQWLSSKGHSISYAYGPDWGWKKEDGILHINPKIYCEQYLSVFKASGKIWNYSKDFAPEELEAIKARIIEKFVKK